MDQSGPDNGLETEEEDSKVADAENKELEDLERRRMGSIGEEIDGEDLAQSFMSETNSYLHIPYGFQSRGSYKHASKNCEIVGGRLIIIIVFCLFIYLFAYLFI